MLPPSKLEFIRFLPLGKNHVKEFSNFGIHSNTLLSLRPILQENEPEIWWKIKNKAELATLSLNVFLENDAGAFH